MEKTNQAFRLIVVRRPYQPRLFGEEEINLKERYKVIATNLDFEPEEVVKKIGMPPNLPSANFTYPQNVKLCKKSN